jgi:hypothetical protein
MRASRIVAFHVEFRLPEGASVADAVEYIETALAAERGIRRPEDPMSRFDRLSLDVRSGEKPLGGR